jgi:hypothetical protein
VLVRQNLFYAAAALLQALFYLAALAGWLFEALGIRSRLFALPQYFVLANLASLLAFYKFLRGERYARWEPIREPANGVAPVHTSHAPHAVASSQGRDA